MRDFVLHTAHLTYRYPQARKPALREVSVRVPRGAFALLAGPSGAGKSTLLRCCNGLVPHFSGGHLQGEISVDGLNPVQCGPQEMSRAVGFVFQEPEAQFVVGRVEDEIAFALENLGLPRAEMQARVAHALDLLDLRPLRSRRVEDLSGGEQQRLAIAAALVLRPRLLVLDEPTSQLAPDSAAEVLAVLQRLNRDLGLTILLAEHRLKRVLPLADYLIVLDADGGLRWQGPAAQGMEHLPWLPPVAELGRRLGWSPLPRSLPEARRFVGAAAAQRESVPTSRAETHAEGAPVLLEVQELSAGYAGKEVLHEVSLQVWRGGVTALMGRNGSGKSTLLKALMGLISLSGGEVRLQGTAIGAWDTPQRARKMAYLPQNPNALLFAETVLEELAVTRRNHGLPVDEGLLLALLRRLGLEEQAGAYPRDLSVGQRQRAALGAVTAVRPQVLLLDEPTRGLDAGARQALIRLLGGWKQAGMGILLVTHDAELCAALADHVVVLEAGRVQAADRPRRAFGACPEFAPQIFRLLPPCLSVDEAVRALQ